MFYIIPLPFSFVLQRNNRLLWDETGLIMLDLFDNIWAEKPTISLDNCVDLTSQVSHIVKIYGLLIKARLTLEDRACCHQCRG